MTMRRVEGCCEPKECCLPVMVGAQRPTGLHRLMQLSGCVVLAMKDGILSNAFEHCGSKLEAFFLFLVVIHVITTRWQDLPLVVCV